MAVFLRRYLFKITLTFSVVKYLGFMPLNPLESETDLAKPKYLTTSSEGSRCRLKKTAITGSNCPFMVEQFSLNFRQVGEIRA